MLYIPIYYKLPKLFFAGAKLELEYMSTDKERVYKLLQFAVTLQRDLKKVFYFLEEYEKLFKCSNLFRKKQWMLV